MRERMVSQKGTYVEVVTQEAGSVRLVECTGCMEPERVASGFPRCSSCRYGTLYRVEWQEGGEQQQIIFINGDAAGAERLFKRMVRRECESAVRVKRGWPENVSLEEFAEAAPDFLNRPQAYGYSFEEAEQVTLTFLNAQHRLRPGHPLIKQVYTLFSHLY